MEIFNSADFLIYSPSPKKVNKATLGYLPLAVQSLCDLATLWHVIDHQMLPTQPLPREAEDFSRGAKYVNHMPLLT